MANGSECRTLKGGHFDSINCCIWNERQQACPSCSCVCTLSLIPRQLQAPVASSAQRPHLDMPGPSAFVTSVTGISDQGQSDACAALFTYMCVSSSRSSSRSSNRSSSKSALLMDPAIVFRAGAVQWRKRYADSHLVPGSATPGA